MERQLVTFLPVVQKIAERGVQLLTFASLDKKRFETAASEIAGM